jgi:hypothetical protein
MSIRTKAFSKSAFLRACAGSILFGATFALGCSSTPPSSAVDDPYDSCSGGDECSGGLACIDTTLPVSSGYSGSLCTSTCGSDSDCLQVPENYSAACVNGQCYLTCPSGSGTCPYSQGCFTFDSNAGSISLCTP